MHMPYKSLAPSPQLVVGLPINEKSQYGKAALKYYYRDFSGGGDEAV